MEERERDQDPLCCSHTLVIAANEDNTSLIRWQLVSAYNYPSQPVRYLQHNVLQ